MMKRRLALYLILAAAVVLLLYMWQAPRDKTAKQAQIDATIQTAEKHYINPNNGLIHAYPDQLKSEYLSESIGLYMEYLVNSNRKQAFSSLYEAFQKGLAVQKEDRIYVKWKADRGTTVNALIDDTRIIKALQKASRMFHDPTYNDTAKTLAASIAKTQMVNGIYADYYDWSAQKAGSRITLSYITPAFSNSLPNTEKTAELLQEAGNQTTESLFFPEYYDIRKGQYVSQEKVHMVDQLLIAINREAHGYPSPAFSAWLQKEWKAKQKLFGQYVRASALPAVDYESLSVYDYLALYFKQTGEEELAAEVQKRARSISSGPLSQETHFFDYIHGRLLQLR